MKDKYRLTIEKLDHYGRGMAHINGKIVFVPYALPSETADIQIEVEKKKYMEASLIELQSSAQDRTLSPCPYFGKCGGCDLFHLKYKKQLSFKEMKVKEILERFGKVDTRVVTPILSSEFVTFYRNKASFKVKEKIGYYGKKSYDLLVIDTCQIVHPRINEILAFLQKEPYLSLITDIIVRVSALGESMVILETKASTLPLHHLTEQVDTVLMGDRAPYKVVSGKGYIIDQIGSYSFKVSPTSFFQINRFMTEKLYDVVYEAIPYDPNQTLLDLYCGTGTLGIYVGDKVGKVIGVEINAEAVENAKENARRNGITNSTFLCKNLTKVKEDFLGEESIDVAIVDPPRAGLEGSASRFLLEQKIPRIIYVSCDPVTLARDLKVLQEFYTVDKVVPVDMFPQTYHVECVSVLIRKDN